MTTVLFIWYPQHLVQFLAQNRCSIKTCWITIMNWGIQPHCHLFRRGCPLNLALLIVILLTLLLLLCAFHSLVEPLHPYVSVFLFLLFPTSLPSGQRENLIWKISYHQEWCINFPGFLTKVISWTTGMIKWLPLTKTWFFQQLACGRDGSIIWNKPGNVNRRIWTWFSSFRDVSW